MLQPYIVVGVLCSSSLTRPAVCFVAESDSPYAAMDEGYRNVDRPSVRLALALRELQHVDRPFDVDLVRRDGRELAAGREERREVEDEVDLELGEDALEDVAVEDGARELARDEAGERRLEGLEVQREDRAVSFGREARDEAVPHLAARARDEDDGGATHQATVTPFSR